MQNDGSDKNENDVDKNVEKDGKPFVDAKHLKRGAHLKRDHFPASDKYIGDTAKGDEVDLSDETLFEKNQ